MQYARQPAASAAPKEQTPEQAQKYLESKGVAGTIQYLAALVLFHKPKDPEEFMIRKLKEMRTFKIRGQNAPLFAREDLTAYFRTLDVTGKGTITSKQYEEAFNCLGVSLPSEIPPLITKGAFVEDAMHAQTAIAQAQ
ncbi:MAG: hypothetical protein SGCHY_000076 [Lobulomycetales sp.]